MAQTYLQHTGLCGQASRFDVIGVLLAGGEAAIEHIENAFELPVR